MAPGLANRVVSCVCMLGARRDGSGSDSSKMVVSIGIGGGRQFSSSEGGGRYSSKSSPTSIGDADLADFSEFFLISAHDACSLCSCSKNS